MLSYELLNSLNEQIVNFKSASSLHSKFSSIAHHSLLSQVVITEVSTFVEQMKLGAQALQGEAASPLSQNGYSPENQIAICHTLINRALQSTEDSDDGLCQIYFFIYKYKLN